MKNKIYLLFPSLITCMIPAYSDTFYVIRGEEVKLEVFNKDKIINVLTLSPGKSITIDYFHRVCAKSDSDKYEVGIDENKLRSLNNESNCYEYKEKVKTSELPNGRFTFTIKSFREILKISSNNPVFIIAEGRSGDAIEISKASFPSISIGLDNNPFSKVELKLIKNKNLIYAKKIYNNFILINDLEVKNNYLLKIYDEKGGIKISQRFLITE